MSCDAASLWALTATIIAGTMIGYWVPEILCRITGWRPFRGSK